MDVLEVKELLGNTKTLHFKTHFFIRVKDRPITKELVEINLKNPKSLFLVETLQSKNTGEIKLKLWFKMSNKYSLIVIILSANKDLYIITAWNTDRKWQKAIQK